MNLSKDLINKVQIDKKEEFNLKESEEKLQYYTTLYKLPKYLEKVIFL